MRVAIYEPNPTGHHFAYLAHAIPALAELGCEPILLTTPAAAAAEQFQQHLQPYAGCMSIDTSLEEPWVGRSVVAVRRQLADLNRATRQIAPDHLQLAYGDALAQVAGLAVRSAASAPWGANTLAELLLLRGGYRYRARNLAAGLRAKIAPYLIRRGPWDRVHHLNPDDLEVLQSLGGEFAQRCHLMPDPIEPPATTTRTEARRALGIAEDGRYIGCAGMIDARKGMDLLIQAFQAAGGRLAEGDRLLLAGPVAPDIRALVDRELGAAVRNGQVVVIDRSLTTADINLAVAALDVVCTPYPLHLHSASIVIRAAAAERPVLASALGWMQRTVHRFGLGSTCCVTDRQSFAEAIVAALQASSGYAASEAAKRLATFHSAPNFVAHWTARVRERMGHAAAPERIGWEWVVEALS